MGGSFDRFAGYGPALTLFAVLGVAAAAVSLALPRSSGPAIGAAGEAEVMA